MDIARSPPGESECFGHLQDECYPEDQAPFGEQRLKKIQIEGNVEKMLFTNWLNLNEKYVSAYVRSNNADDVWSYDASYGSNG